jgi:hypothetical protein
MNRYELYELRQGRLHPTGLWKRGNTLESVEKELSKHTKGRKGPFAILVSYFKI